MTQAEAVSITEILGQSIRVAQEPTHISAVAALYDAYRAAYDALVGVVNQPRITSCDSVLTVLEQSTEDLFEKMQRTVTWLSRVKPIGESAKADRGRVIVDWAIMCGINWNDAVRMAAEEPHTKH